MLQLGGWSALWYYSHWMKAGDHELTAVSLTATMFIAGDDHQALIWDIQQMPRAIEDPILAYTAGGEINQIQWSSTQPDWISICYNNCMEILRV